MLPTTTEIKFSTRVLFLQKTKHKKAFSPRSTGTRTLRVYMIVHTAVTAVTRVPVGLPK